MTSHTANTHLASVSGLSGVQSSLSLNVANSTRVLAPPAITTEAAVTTADEQFVDGRDIASMGLGSALNVITTNIAAAFFNPSLSSLPPPAAIGSNVVHFSEPRPAQGNLGWQLPQGTAAVDRPEPNTYRLSGVPGETEITVAIGPATNGSLANVNAGENGQPQSAFTPGNQGDGFAARIYGTMTAGVITATLQDGATAVDISSAQGMNVLGGTIFGNGNPPFEPGMYIRTAGGAPPAPDAGVITIFDNNDNLVDFTPFNTDVTIAGADSENDALILLDQLYTVGVAPPGLAGPVSKVAVTLNAGDATPAFLSFGPDTAANARRLHDMIFGSTEDRSESKSTVLTMNTLSVNAATDFFFGNTQEVAGVVQPADPDTEAVWVSWSEDLEAANDPPTRLQGVEVSSNAATTQYHIRMLAEWRADDGRMRFSVVDREAL